jgi:hypothetical protein
VLLRKNSSVKVRLALAKSNVAAVTAAVLLLWCGDFLFEALWPIMTRAGVFVATAVAMREVPYFSRGVDAQSFFLAIDGGFYLYGALVSGLAAYLICRWIYGVGPLSVFRMYFSRSGGLG